MSKVVLTTFLVLNAILCLVLAVWLLQGRELFLTLLLTGSGLWVAGVEISNYYKNK